MRTILGFVVFLCVAFGQANAQRSTTVFEGFPTKKVESAFVDTRTEALTKNQSFEYQVRVLERNGKYYWASREMRQLLRSESGPYITFHAVDGSGYIRIYQDFMYEMMKQLPEEQRKQEIGYVEHLVIQFGSVTYYGNRSR